MPTQELLFGRNAVREALRAGRRHPRRLLLASGDKEGPRDIAQLARRGGVVVTETTRQALDRLLPASNHQGVALETSAYAYASLPALLEAGDAEPLLLALDRLQDPQNVGALLRTAEAVGVTGVLIPEHRAAAVTPAVVNASAGATEHLAIVPVTNMTVALKQLKAHGYWVVGLEAVEGAREIESCDLAGPLIVVVGSEGAGISRLVRESCDYLVRLPMRGAIASLNAAVAGSVALYFIDRQRRAAGDPARARGDVGVSSANGSGRGSAGG